MHFKRVYIKNAALVSAESVIARRWLWCHEIELMLEWMLHDLSTLTSPDEWSEKNEEIWKETREKRLRKSYRSSVWEMSDKLTLNELMNRFYNMQRRKINCLNDPSQNTTVKWLNIYLCSLFSFFCSLQKNTNNISFCEAHREEIKEARTGD